MEIITLSRYLEKSTQREDLQKVVLALAEAAPRIAECMQKTQGRGTGETNMFGEEQLALDVESDRIMQEVLRNSGVVGLIASEELSEEVRLGTGPFAVAYDPLDGSSLVDVNLSVGSIFSIYENNRFVGLTGDEQIAAGCMVYGPRITMLLTLKNGVSEFLYDKTLASFIVTRENIKILEAGKMFAPGNLRATKYRKEYVELMKYWMEEQYTLRYSGGMVPDINQIILKGKGIFTYPGYEEAPEGKLRILMECNAMALLVEQAGGKATDGKMRILEKRITGLSMRTPIYIGSKSEVDRAEQFLQ